MTYFEIVIIAVAVFGSAVIKNGVGVGAGIFLLPFLALALPPKLALGLGAPAMLISDIVGVKNYWGEWDRKELMILIPLASLGVILGTYLIKIAPDTLFKQGIGIFALTFSSFHIIKMIRGRYYGKKDVNITEREFTGSKAYSALFGLLGGVASTVAHAGGLMMSVYMLQKRSNPRIFVATFVLFFAFINLFKIAAYAKIDIINMQVMIIVAMLSPVIIFGGMIGNILNKKFSQELFRFIVLILIFIIGLRLHLSV
jgi:uncharacterized membrane protein YfcA